MNKLIILLLVAAVSGEVINAENALKGPATEFITGLLKGLNEEKSIEHLKDCMKNIDEILIKIKEAFDLIKKMTYHDIINGIKIIIEIYNNLYNMIKPCGAGYNIIEKFIAAITKMSIAQFIKKLHDKYDPIISALVLFITYFCNGNYNYGGFYLGTLLRILFLEEGIEITAVKPETDFTLSFLNAIGDNSTEKKIEKCTFSFNKLIDHLKSANNYIKSGDDHKIITATIKIISASMGFLNPMKLCVGNLPNFHKLEQIVQKANPRKFSQKIIKNKSKCLEYLNQILTSHSSKNYKKAGTAYGNLLKLIFV